MIKNNKTITIFLLFFY